VGVVFPGGKAAPPVRHAQVHAFVTVPSWFRFPFLPKPCSTWGRLRPRDSDRTGCCRPFPHPRGGGCVPGTVRIRFTRAMRFHVARSRPLRSVVWVVLPFDRGFERTGRSGGYEPTRVRKGRMYRRKGRKRPMEQKGWVPFCIAEEKGFLSWECEDKRIHRLEGEGAWEGCQSGEPSNTGPPWDPLAHRHGVLPPPRTRHKVCPSQGTGRDPHRRTQRLCERGRRHGLTWPESDLPDSIRLHPSPTPIPTDPGSPQRIRPASSEDPLRLHTVGAWGGGSLAIAGGSWGDPHHMPQPQPPPPRRKQSSCLFPRSTTPRTGSQADVGDLSRPYTWREAWWKWEVHLQGKAQHPTARF